MGNLTLSGLLNALDGVASAAPACPTTCHYQIFDENQNPVDMHTSIMCINILQNIKAVARKIEESQATVTEMKNRNMLKMLLIVYTLPLLHLEILI
jgi:hypothetical protein